MQQKFILQLNKHQSKDKIVADIFRDSFIIMLIMVLVGSIASGIDSAVAGNFLTVEAVSAIGIIYPFTKLLECISKIFSSGVQIVCSGQLGEGKMKEVNRTFSSVAIVVLVVSIIITIIVIALKTPLSLLFGARVEAGTLALTEKYLFAFALGTPGCLATTFLIPMLQMDGDKKRVNTASIVMMVTNVAFSIISVVCLNMGVEGIGYGTALSYYASAAVLLSHFASKNCRLKFNFREADFRHTWKVISVGSVAAAKLLVSAVNNIVINNLVAAFGDVNAMAAFSVFKATKHFFVSFDDAAADAVRLLTGMFWAEKDRRGLRQLFKSAFSISFTGSAIISILLFIFAEPFFSLFISGEALSITVVLMRIFVISIIVDVAAFFYLSYFQCLNKKTYVLILILCMNGISMLAAWAFGAWWGITGIWWSIAFSDTLCAVVAFVLVFINNKRVRISIDDLMMIPEDFGGKERDRFDVSIIPKKVKPSQNQEYTADRETLFENVHVNYEVTDNRRPALKMGKNKQSNCAAESIPGSYLMNTFEIYKVLFFEVNVFCEAHEFSRQKTNHCLLSVEETISNILEHGFENRKNSIDLRITAESETLLIRMRDNCRAFNPTDLFEKYGESTDITNKKKQEWSCSSHNKYEENLLWNADNKKSSYQSDSDMNEYTRNGLKIIKAVTTDAEYVNAYGLNCLSFKIV